MKKLISRILLLAPITLSLVSCGLDLRETYENDAYNNPIFKENYYQVYSKQIKPKDDTNSKPLEVSNRNDNITEVKEHILQRRQYELDYKSAARFDPEINNYHDDNKFGLEHDGLSYEDGNVAYIQDNIAGYGPVKKLNRIDDMFKYGVTSKLYDGEMFCGGRFQLSRVQLDERGFGQIYEKELIKYDYFACNFKAAINDPEKEYSPYPGVYSEVMFYVNFYMRDGNSYTVERVGMKVDKIPTGFQEADYNDCYIFLSFNLNDLDEQLDLRRCCGYSIDYELNKEALVADSASRDNTISDAVLDRMEYAIMLYEVLMPNSSWQ